MLAYLVDDTKMALAFLGTANEMIRPIEIQQWAHVNGKALDVVSWDSDFRLVAEAFEGLPDNASKLYGRESLQNKRIDGADAVIGYATSDEASEILESLPLPDFGNPPAEVIAAREELEGWLRAATARQQSLLLIWD